MLYVPVKLRVIGNGCNLFSKALPIVHSEALTFKEKIHFWKVHLICE
uniref:Uncharacterized protein n=1 Tax=Ciona intestinalis TaxID=7719 RepID=H2Y0R1_CIOIN